MTNTKMSIEGKGELVRSEFDVKQSVGTERIHRLQKKKQIRAPVPSMMPMLILCENKLFLQITR